MPRTLKEFGSFTDVQVPAVAQLESFRGSDIVAWHGRIDAQLTDHIDRLEADRLLNDANQVRALQMMWRARPLTADINVEDVDVLLAAVKMLAASKIKLNKYFAALAGNLNRLKASEQELPRIPSSTGNEADLPAGAAPSTAGRFAADERPTGSKAPDKDGGPEDEELPNPAAASA